MGANKAFLELEGKSLLNRALDTLKAACGSVAIVGDPVMFANFGPVVADVFPNCGPLGGIHAALAASAVEFNVIVAVDMPFVSPKLIAFLFAAAEASDAIVTVPRTRTGFQPLCAVYRRAFASTAERALQDGRCKVDASFAHLPLCIVEESELLQAGFSENDFFNVNTPEDRRTAADRV
jgi:molybdopterin-guanine dinucleotide biosynthesis protein A